MVASRDYNGDGTADIAVFRPSSGMWSVRNLTVTNYGIASDQAAPGNYDGDGMDDLAIFRDYSSLWAIRELTREYFGSANDIPLTR